MRRPSSASGRAGVSAAILAALLAGCVAVAPPPARPMTTAPPATRTMAAPPATTRPTGPVDLAAHKIDRTFPDVTALTSTGDSLLWASGAEVWRFAPGEADATLLYESAAAGTLVWDIAAATDGFVLSERLDKPVGAWRVQYVAGVGGVPVQIDGGVAERGAPPTVAIDDARIAWAGFDEADGAPESFLRIVDRADASAPRTLAQASIDDGLIWYPQLDRESLWYSVIEPDFDGTRGGDRFHIASMDLGDPASEADRFQGLERVFEAAVSPDFVAWKQVEPGLSALTWGELHVLDRRSGERLDIPGQANHPSLGSRFVACEEVFHRKVLLFDLATGTSIDVPDPLPDRKGTVGPAVVGGSLLGFTVSRRGETAVLWASLPA